MGFEVGQWWRKWGFERLKMKGIGAKMMIFKSATILGSRPHGFRQGVDGVRHIHKMLIGPYFSYGFWALAWFGFLSGGVCSIF